MTSETTQCRWSWFCKEPTSKTVSKELKAPHTGGRPTDSGVVLWFVLAHLKYRMKRSDLVQSSCTNARPQCPKIKKYWEMPLPIQSPERQVSWTKILIFTVNRAAKSVTTVLLYQLPIRCSPKLTAG